MTQMLATTTGGGGFMTYWPIFAMALQMIFNVILGLGLWWVKTKSERIGQLEIEVTEAAEQLIESKLKGMGDRLEHILTLTNERIQSIHERLARGDRDMTELDKRDRELEQRWGIRFDQLKDHMHSNFASKSELRAVHKRINEQLAQMGQQ